MWGVPSFTYANNCSRGLSCAVKLSLQVPSVGHNCSIGLTSGTCVRVCMCKCVYVRNHDGKGSTHDRLLTPPRIPPSHPFFTDDVLFYSFFFLHVNTTATLSPFPILVLFFLSFFTQLSLSLSVLIHHPSFSFHVFLLILFLQAMFIAG